MRGDAAARASRARELHAEGLSHREIARRLSVDESTVRGYLRHDDQGPSGSSASARRRRTIGAATAQRIEQAALAFHVRFGLYPTAASWNATKMRQKGGLDWIRYLEGWAPLEVADDPAAWGAWPAPSAVASAVGGFEELRRRLKASIVEARRQGRVIEVAHPTPLRRLQARLRAEARDADLENVAARSPEPDDRVSVAVDGVPVVPALRLDDGWPRSIRRRPGDRVTAIPGGRGTGKTSLLARLAWQIALESGPPLVVIERAPGTITSIVYHAGAGISALLPEDIVYSGAMLASGCPLAFVSDDTDARAQALCLALQTIGRHPRALVIDDAEDLLPDIVAATALVPANASLAAAWHPRATGLDRAFLAAAEVQFVFRFDDADAADALAPFVRA